jgi:hypothetical protein
MAHKWTEKEIKILTENYPKIGKFACAKLLNMTESQIRQKASKLGLKQDRTSDFFKEWQAKSAKSNTGTKRPSQSKVMKDLHKEGKLKQTFEQRSKASKLRWKNMSEETKDGFSKRANENMGIKYASLAGKWKAAWYEIGGIRKYYRSRWEANYAKYLQWLLENKEIQKWEHEPQTFWFEGIKRGVMSYLPDFRVTENDGSIAYHEVKGWMDDRSKTKIKRMAKYYPNVKLIVIDSKTYKSLEKKAKLLVKDWE